MENTPSIRALDYPESVREERVDVLHDVAVPDPYRWLEEIDSEQTRRWIAQQNALTEQYLARIPARKTLTERLTALWNYEKYGVPFKRGDRYFFTRNDGLQNQSVLCWLDALHAEPRVLLDPNTLSDDGTVALMDYAVSDNGALLAYGLSAAGSDWLEWRVREIVSGRDRADLVQWSKFSGAAWSPDGAGFFYSRYDAPSAGSAYKGANYHHKLYFHRLGTPQAEDVLIHADAEHKEWGFGGEVTDDGRYLVISVWRGTHRENGILFKDLSSPDAPVQTLLLDWDAAYHFIGNDGSRFLFHTDNAAPLGRVIAIDVTQPERDHWHELVPETADTLQAVSLVGDRLIATYLHDAHSRVAIYDLEGAQIGDAPLPGTGTAVGFGGRRDDPETFYQYTDFTTPGTIFRYDVAGGDSTVFRAPRLLFDPTEYETQQVFYRSNDGTRVPMFITHRRGLVRNGATPTLLYGYGGFDIPLTPAFSVANLVWMELGGVFVQASLRGGGEYGKSWHEGGMLGNKQNVFDDFIAAAEWLIANGYTRAGRLAIEGRSNGGLLVGAAMTQRPDLFGACLPTVGVLDMLRFHRWTIGWAWVSDYGSPDDPDDFQTLLRYSPYHNVQPGTRYPPTLICTGDHDDRVFPAHSYKFAAALQAAQAGAAPILIRIETRAGHGAGKPTAKLIAETADKWAFLVQALAIDPA